MRRPLSSLHPALYRIRVLQRQLFRLLRWHFGPERFALRLQGERLPHKVYRHQSKLRRALCDSPMDASWQANKIFNHGLAIPHLDGILIRPGQTFSFWRLVGRPSVAKGYREGMELHLGEARGGVGGGLCQLGNLIHWLALHSPLLVTQRANHSFDPFPDQGRLIPYGTGAALFYNYIDLWLYNPTPATFQLKLWLTETLVNGELLSDRPPSHRYHVFERFNRFQRDANGWLRHNEIWRDVFSAENPPRLLRRERLYGNSVRVMYEPGSADPTIASE
jgi:vancomycin resistance protein VanW